MNISVPEQVQQVTSQAVVGGLLPRIDTLCPTVHVIPMSALDTTCLNSSRSCILMEALTCVVECVYSWTILIVTLIEAEQPYTTCISSHKSSVAH